MSFILNSGYLRKPLVISTFWHMLFVFIILVLWRIQDHRAIPKKIEFTVLMQKEPMARARPFDDKPASQPLAKKIETVKPRVVFGLNRNALTTTSDSGDINSVNLKDGNTIAKQQDQEKLNAEDPSSLPVPTDEFLVTSMPVLISEVRIPYPKSAREANIEGPVVLDLLIDTEGKVRSVQLVSGPGYGLDDAAMNAVRGFRFKPAQLDAQTVIVKIRYTYRFILETR
jgi:protein TonB